MQAGIQRHSIGGLLRTRLFGISSQETSFERRGFRGGTPATRQRLEQVGAAFMQGYQAALMHPRGDALVIELDGTPWEFRGFAYEGAAMGLALLDWLTPWARTRVNAFLRGAGNPHSYMVHVGAGWALARVPGSVERFLSRFDPLLKWLLIDGYGFHEAFFHFPRYLRQQAIPNRLRGYARRVFDQGFGRCLWFVGGAEVPRVARTVAAFPQERQGDLWSGVGLASVYAGQVPEAELRMLRQAAGPYAPQLGQGATFAAKARGRAGNPTAYTDAACRVLCGLSAPEAAQLTDLALENLPVDGAEPAYEVWRRRVQQNLERQQELTR